MPFAKAYSFVLLLFWFFFSAGHSSTLNENNFYNIKLAL